MLCPLSRVGSTSLTSIMMCKLCVSVLWNVTAATVSVPTLISASCWRYSVAMHTSLHEKRAAWCGSGCNEVQTMRVTDSRACWSSVGGRKGECVRVGVLVRTAEHKERFACGGTAWFVFFMLIQCLPPSGNWVTCINQVEAEEKTMTAWISFHKNVNQPVRRSTFASPLEGATSPPKL